MKKKLERNITEEIEKKKVEESPRPVTLSYNGPFETAEERFNNPKSAGYAWLADCYSRGIFSTICKDWSEERVSRLKSGLCRNFWSLKMEKTI